MKFWLWMSKSYDTGLLTRGPQHYLCNIYIQFFKRKRYFFIYFKLKGLIIIHVFVDIDASEGGERGLSEA